MFTFVIKAALSVPLLGQTILGTSVSSLGLELPSAPPGGGHLHNRKAGESRGHQEMAEPPSSQAWLPLRGGEADFRALPAQSTHSEALC